MSVRRFLAAALLSLSVLVGVVVTGPAPAPAANYWNVFNLAYGQSVAAGTIHFYNRSVNIHGYVRTTANNCRAIYAIPKTVNDVWLDWSARNYAAACTLSADVPGGAAYVRICLTGDSYTNFPPAAADYRDLDCEEVIPWYGG